MVEYSQRNICSSKNPPPPIGPIIELPQTPLHVEE